MIPPVVAQGLAIASLVWGQPQCGQVRAEVYRYPAGDLSSGMAVIGGQTASNALAADLYPTAIRSTGVGWALGVGRVGSILGPILGGVLLSYGGGARRTFWAAAAPALIATCAALAISSNRAKRV